MYQKTAIPPMPDIALPTDPVIRHVVTNYITNIHSEYPKGLMLWGEPGIAKTQRVYQAAEFLGRFVPRWLNVEWKGCSVMRLGQAIDATEIIGVATIAETFSRWFTPEGMPRTGAGIFFCDEFNLGQPELQNAIRQLVDEGELTRCGYKIPREYLIVGAGNPPECGAATTFDIDPIMNNRWDNMVVERPTKDQWLQWAYGSGKIAPSIMAFLDVSSGWMYKFPKEQGKYVQTESWPSFRSWERLSAKLLSVPSSWLKNTDYVFEISANAVGSAAATMFKGFLDYRDQLRHPSEYLDGAKNIELPTETKFKFALVSSVSEYIVEELRKRKAANEKGWFGKAKKDITTPMCVLMDKLGEQFGILLLRMVKSQEQPILEPIMISTPYWNDKLSIKWGKYL